MRIAVVGGGINGVMSAWALARRGHAVSLFERGEIMGATSSASTKLLHGGIRYLEQGHIGLVREALGERTWWIKQAPHLAHALEILIPVYQTSRRGRLALRVGLGLYDLLAGRRNLGRTRWLKADVVLARAPTLRSAGLLGAYSFHDGQMDDQALGLWAAGQAQRAGTGLHPKMEVARVSVHGDLVLADGETYHFDRVVNAAGPWAEALLQRSGIASKYAIDPVRGSHLLIDRPCPQAMLLEVPDSARIAFVLPYQGKTLIGTTEVRQSLQAPVTCSADEKSSLIAFYNAYFADVISDAPESFAGLRPLLKSSTDPSRSSREYAIVRQENLITVFGGKWTTARVLGEKVARMTVE